jgi:N-acetylneuraminic acid mutarotase
VKANVSSTTKAHLIRGAFYVLLLLTGTLLGSFRPEAPTTVSNSTLTFAERVSYQRTIEEVYWRHRIWPEENLNPKPSLDAVMSQVQLEKKVTDYLRNSQALEDYLQRPITGEQLQAEMDRMAEHSKEPKVLRELFKALGDDPFIIAECLARPILSERLKPATVGSRKGSLDSWRAGAENQMPKVAAVANTSYTLPRLSDDPNGCIDDTWRATSTTNPPAVRYFHTAVWTGSQMIIWGGLYTYYPWNTGGRYDPATNSWTDTSTTDAPSERYLHTAVWTGSEMIVWGGAGCPVGCSSNTGGRYNPSTDSWTATSTTNAPTARFDHRAVWTGSEMIVWGGRDGFDYYATGGRYNPSTDSWTATSTTGAPAARAFHAAVWTGSEMIVWSGYDGFNFLNTGGRYSASTDSWTATSTTNAPTARFDHTAVWTGSEMIVWGGSNGIGSYLNTGGRYNPSTNSWVATSTTNAPTAREFHTAIWTDNEMIIWGGFDGNPNDSNSGGAYAAPFSPPTPTSTPTPSATGTPTPAPPGTGGRYNPSTDSWTATTTTHAPDERYGHTAIWGGSQMIVWGGLGDLGDVNTGGRYCAQSGAPTPTPTPTQTPTPTPTVTPTPSEAPCAAFDSQPACNSTVFTQLIDFIVYITGFVSSLPPPSVFTVNGIPADSVSGGGSTIEFHFIASPVIPGENTMDIPPGAFTCSNSGRGFEGFHCTFTYQASTPTPTPTPTPAPRSTPVPRLRPTPAPRP